MDTRNIGDVGAADPDGKYSGKRMSRIYKERFYAVCDRCSMQLDVGLMPRAFSLAVYPPSTNKERQA